MRASFPDKKYSMKPYILYAIPLDFLPELAEIFVTRCGHGMVRGGGGFNHAPACQNNHCNLNDEQWAEAYETAQKLVPIFKNGNSSCAIMKKDIEDLEVRIRKAEKASEVIEDEKRLYAQLQPTDAEVTLADELKRLRRKLDAIRLP